MARASHWDAELDRELADVLGVVGGGRAAALLGITKGQLSGRSRVLRLHRSGGGETAKPLRADHPALANARTIFPSRVVPAHDGAVLKSGDNSPKLGRLVTKGAWAGMPIYSLTLEERATCPVSCAQWASCYGSTMPFAKRIQHGPELEAALDRELAALQRRNRRGFVVRLHILGDFPSTDNVRAWAAWLDRFPALHVFGYSARQLSDPIGQLVHDLARRRFDRFAVRQSSTMAGAMRAVVVENEAEAQRRGLTICPAQTGKTSCCGTCGLCWSPAFRKKPIAFLRHGMVGGRR